MNKQVAIDGASVQGFYKNEKIHKDHKSGHLKRIMPKSDGYGGFALNIGTPRRLIIFEAPINMMSYYDLHKEKLTDVKLVACDGYKPMAYARYIIEILNPTWVYNSTSEGQQDVYDRIQKIEEVIPNIEGLPQNFITFAYDNDAAGNQFIQQFRETYPNIGKLSQSDLPPLEEGQLKSDWNDYLQKNKKEIKNTIMNDNLLKNYYEMSLKDIRKGFDQFMTHTEDIEYRQEMWENLKQNHKKYRTQKFERQVSKGSKSLKVYVPKIQKLKDDEGKVKLDPNGKEMTRTYFQLGSVFDVSQTTGKEIPKPVHQLEGEVKNYSNIYAALTKTTKAEIGFTDISSSVNGFYQPDADIIRIQKGMKQEQTIKTVIHEIAHSNLHNLEARKKHEYTKEEKELQAESVAYVVSNHLGIDTSSYSFGYLANWSSDKNTLDHLESSMSIIRDEAAKIISRLDQELTQVKTKSATKDSLESDIEKARLKQQQMEVNSQSKKEQRSLIQDNQEQQKEQNKK